MLEQLYYTWSTIGYGDIPGFRLRAASPGLADINGERYNALRSFFNYYLPPGTDPYQAAIELSPRCLLYAANSYERLVAHKTYGNKDDYGRPGNFFTHLVAGLPESFVARDAIALWGATAFWQSSDKTIPSATTLPTLSSDFNTGYPEALNEDYLRPARERNLPSLSEYLPLLIQAYLSLEDQQTIYIAAPPEQVAALIWGLTQCLPRSMQRELTFSTYESDVLKAATRIIGTCEPQTPMLNGYNKASQLLPSSCYNEGNWVIDCYCPPLAYSTFISPDIVEFSRRATRCLLKGERTNLHEALDIAEVEFEHVPNSQELPFDLELAISFMSGKPLNRARVEKMLGNSATAIKGLWLEPFQTTLISIALANLQWWERDVRFLFLKFYDPFDEKLNLQIIDAQAAFGNRVAIDLGTAMMRDDPIAASLIRMLSAFTPPDKEFRPWLRLLQFFYEQSQQDRIFYPAKAFDWETRLWLLRQWIHGAASIPNELIRLWLQLNWNEFIEFLTWGEAPEKWYRIALEELLDHSSKPIPDKIVRFLKDPRYAALVNDPKYDAIFKYDLQQPQTREEILRSSKVILPTQPVVAKSSKVPAEVPEELLEYIKETLNHAVTLPTQPKTQSPGFEYKLAKAQSKGRYLEGRLLFRLEQIRPIISQLESEICRWEPKLLNEWEHYARPKLHILLSSQMPDIKGVVGNRNQSDEGYAQR